METLMQITGLTRMELHFYGAIAIGLAGLVYRRYHLFPSWHVGRFQSVAATGTVAAQITADDAGAIATQSTSTTPLVAILDGNVTTSGSASTFQLRVARGGTSNTITILSATIIAHPL